MRAKSRRQKHRDALESLNATINDNPHGLDPRRRVPVPAALSSLARPAVRAKVSLLEAIRVRPPHLPNDLLRAYI